MSGPENPLNIVGLILIVTILYRVWKFRMALKDPEQYRRLREWEDEQKERRNKAIVGTATSGVKAAMVIAKLLKK